MSIKVVLDAGHGKTGNPYPPQKGFYEGTKIEINGKKYITSTYSSDNVYMLIQYD